MKFLFFAQCRQWMKCSSMHVPLEKPEILIRVLKNQSELAPLIDHMNILKVAVNCEFADFNAEVHSGDEVAFLPPVSGG